MARASDMVKIFEGLLTRRKANTEPTVDNRFEGNHLVLVARLPGCKSLTYLHGTVEHPAFRVHLSHSQDQSCGTWKSRTPALTGRQTVRHAVGGAGVT